MLKLIGCISLPMVSIKPVNRSKIGNQVSNSPYRGLELYCM